MEAILLSMNRTAAQTEVKSCFSFFVLSVLGAALCKFCQRLRSSAPLFHGHSQSTCWKPNRFEGLFPWGNTPISQTAWLVTVHGDGSLCCEGPFNSIFSWTWRGSSNVFSSFMIHLGIGPAWPLQHMYGLFLLIILNYAQNMYLNFVPNAELYAHFCICIASTICKYLTCAQSVRSVSETAWVSHLDGWVPGRVNQHI